MYGGSGIFQRVSIVLKKSIHFLLNFIILQVNVDSMTSASIIIVSSDLFFEMVE
jgi:hypothetical protein